MSKFAKRIKKLNKKARNVLVVGNAWGNVQEIIDSYNTIFLVDNHQRVIRARNIVYRENFDNIHSLHDVDVILLDLDHQNHLVDLLPLFKRWSSLIIIEGPELISKENQTFLKAHNYQIVEIHKTYFQWKLR